MIPKAQLSSIHSHDNNLLLDIPVYVRDGQNLLCRTNRVNRRNRIGRVVGVGRRLPVHLATSSALVSSGSFSSPIGSSAGSSVPRRSNVALNALASTLPSKANVPAINHRS